SGTELRWSARDGTSSLGERLGKARTTAGLEHGAYMDEQHRAEHSPELHAPGTIPTDSTRVIHPSQSQPGCHRCSAYSQDVQEERSHGAATALPGGLQSPGNRAFQWLDRDRRTYSIAARQAGCR